MKTLITLFVLLSSTAFASLNIPHNITELLGGNPTINLRDVDKGLLVNSPMVKLTGGGSATVNLVNGDFFQIQGLGDRVEMQNVSTKNWLFDSNKVIYGNALPVSNPARIKAENIRTVTATALHDNETQYLVHVIQQMRNSEPHMRIISVQGVLPEPSEFALIAGMFGLGCVMMRRRCVNR